MSSYVTALAFVAGLAAGFVSGVSYVAAHTKKVDRFFGGTLIAEPTSNVEVNVQQLGRTA